MPSAATLLPVCPRLKLDNKSIPANKDRPTANHLLNDFIMFPFAAQPGRGNEEARTQRALARGTAKRLAHKHAEPRPMGRGFGRLCAGAGLLAVFWPARSRSCTNYFVLMFSYMVWNDSLITKSFIGFCPNFAKHYFRIFASRLDYEFKLYQWRGIYDLRGALGSTRAGLQRQIRFFSASPAWARLG